MEIPPGPPNLWQRGVDNPSPFLPGDHLGIKESSLLWIEIPQINGFVTSPQIYPKLSVGGTVWE